MRLYIDGTSTGHYQVHVHLTDDAPGEDPRLLSWGTYTIDAQASPGLQALDIEMSITGRRIPAGNRIGITITNIDWEVVAPGLTPMLRHIPIFELNTSTVRRSKFRPSSVTIPLLLGSGALAPDDVWVDFSATDGGSGAEGNPFNSIDVASDTVQTGGDIYLLPGSTTVTELFTSSKPVQIYSAPPIEEGPQRSMSQAGFVSRK